MEVKRQKKTVSRNSRKLKKIVANNVGKPASKRRDFYVVLSFHTSFQISNHIPRKDPESYCVSIVGGLFTRTYRPR
jgi:phage/plasmid-associated DNA primase